MNQGDFIDKDNFIVLICNIDDIKQYTQNEQKARELINNDKFRQNFIDNLMQNWDLSLSLAINENIK